MTDMIVGAVAPRIQYVADGAQLNFTFPFPILQAGDLTVVFGEADAPSPYSVTGVGASAGGTVTFDAAPAAGTLVTILRDMAYERLADFQEGADFRAAAINEELDRLTMMVQQLDDRLRRSAVLPASSMFADLSLSEPEGGRALKWNGDGSGFENSAYDPDAAAAAAADSAATAAASAAAALGSENNAAASEAKAQKWADEAEDVAVETGKYSAKHWAAKALAANLLLGAGNIMSPLVHLPLKNGLSGDYAGASTFTRSTTGTYIDRYGVVRTAAANAPRFEKRGLLMEGASTNVLAQSQTFDNAAWSKLRTTVSANAGTAPDGTATADKLVEDATATSNHHLSKSLGWIAGTAYTLSVFVQAAERTKIQLSLPGTAFPSAGSPYAKFELVPGAGAVFAQADLARAIIEELADGWFRCSITAAADTSTTGSVSFFLLDAAGEGYYDGDGSSGLYLWGAQVEAKPFATSYIPTTTAAVTRTADAMSLTYDGNIPAIGDPMTILADVGLLGLKAADQRLFIVWGESSRQIKVDGSGRLRAIYGTSNTYSDTIDALFVGQSPHRIGAVYDGSSIEVFADGVGSGSPAVTDTPTGTAFEIRIFDNSFEAFGHISNFRIYDRALTDDEMRIA